MELILIRHTKVAVEKGICYGHTDVDVANSFEEEALVVKKQINNLHPQNIWTSPLLRCIKLTKYLFPSQIANSDDRLKELNFGEWEMQTWDSISQIPQGRKWMDDYVNEKCPQGESFLDQHTRVKDFIEDKIANSNSDCDVIVAHGGTIRSILCYLQNIDLNKIFEINIDYGSVTRIQLNKHL